MRDRDWFILLAVVAFPLVVALSMLAQNHQGA